MVYGTPWTPNISSSGITMTKLLEIRDLVTEFDTEAGVVHAVEHPLLLLFGRHVIFEN